MTTAAVVPVVNKEVRPGIKYLKVEVVMISFVSQEPFWNQWEIKYFVKTLDTILVISIVFEISIGFGTSTLRSN